VWQDGFRGGRAKGRPSLKVRLLATALCLLAAWAGIIGAAGYLVARGYLVRQADQQLRAYADRLTSHPFEAVPFSAPVPAAGPGHAGLGIEVRGSGGQLVMRAGSDPRPGPVIPPVSARIAAHTGRLVTITAGGASWRLIAEPIHYRARRIPFAYSAQDFALFITGNARPGRAGTLVVGLDLAGVGQATGRLTVAGLAVGGAMILAVACLGAVAIGAILRPIGQLEQAARALAAGEMSRRPPGRPSGGASRLGVSLSRMLSQAEHTLAARAESEAAARRSSEQMRRIICDTGRRLRRPLSVIHGSAESYRQGGRSRAGEPDRVMKRVADEAAHINALLDELLPTDRDRPPRP
jgi:two-component system, OmpR family, sensor kinase